MVFALAALGCRPSIRMAQPGNSYFERCYAADQDPEVGDAHRLECWQVWLDHYTEGQSTERVRHARERVEALVLAVHGAPAVEPPTPADAGVAATDDGGAPSPDAGTTAAAGPTPGACPARPDARVGVACPSPPDDAAGPCADVCNPRWYRCVSRCAGYERRCLDACELEHRTCMAACY